MRKPPSQFDLPEVSASGNRFALKLVDHLKTLAASITDLINRAAAGELRESVATSGDYVALETDCVIEVTPSAPCTVTLPLASAMRGRTVTVKRMNNTTHTITVQPSSGTIDGAASMTLTTSFQKRHFFSDGSVWSEH
jgi:hypothetical protein